MSQLNRQRILIALALFFTALAFFVPRVAQDPGYHHFADTRAWLGIPNFGDVFSNLPFVLAAWLGLVWNDWRQMKTRTAYLIFLFGLALTGVGSSYYHLAPSTERLFWDRLPMTIAFMGFISILISERVSMKWGARLVFPLLALGSATVIYWIWSEGRGAGDLRPYGLIQFGTMAISLAIVALFTGPRPGIQSILVLFVGYSAAKVLEFADHQIFSATAGMVSGHSLKHLAAGLGCIFFLKMCGLGKRT